MTEADFAQHKDGLRGRWKEKPKNIGQEATRYWSQIDSGYLDFHRRANDADILSNITKDDVLKLFLSHVHPASPTRAKLSVHLQSQKPRAKTVSPAASEAFSTSVKGAGIAVDEAALNAEIGDQLPTLQDYLKFWKTALEKAGVGADTLIETLRGLPAIVDAHPVPGEEVGGTVPGATYITSMKDFKRTLTVTEDPKPVVDWGDLPTPRF